MARDVQDGLTERMIYQRHVGMFLVFPVGGVRFNLQVRRFFPSYGQKHNNCVNIPSSQTLRSYLSSYATMLFIFTRIILITASLFVY
jgi:hypothetical protein